MQRLARAAWLWIALLLPASVFAESYVKEPDMPADYRDSNIWTEQSMGVCTVGGKEYKVEVFIKLLPQEKKIDYVAVLSIDKQVFKYAHAKGPEKGSDFFYTYYRAGDKWVKLSLDKNREDEHIDEALRVAELIKNQMSPGEYYQQCHLMNDRLGKFRQRAFKKLENR